MTSKARRVRKSRVVAVLSQQEERKEPEQQNIKFFLDRLPRQPDTRYLILSNGIIEADKIIMA